jgi:hypothetical protein
MYCTSRPGMLSIKRYRRIWRRRSAIKMGQKSEEFREKRENIISLKVGGK